jgi:hypothetical protein
MCPRSLMLDFSMYQSGIDFKCPYSNRPLMPATPLNRLNAIFLLAVDRIAKSPYQFNWSMSSATGLYAACLSQLFTSASGLGYYGRREGQCGRSHHGGVHAHTRAACHQLPTAARRRDGCAGGHTRGRGTIHTHLSPVTLCPQPKEAQPLSQLDTRSIQHFDSTACGLMVRRWRLIGYFPILYYPQLEVPPRGHLTSCRSNWQLHSSSPPPHPLLAHVDESTPTAPHRL